MEKPTEFKINGFDNSRSVPLKEIIYTSAFSAGTLALELKTLSKPAIQSAVEALELVEWTGKLDKNGIKIFDKDIVDARIQNEFGSFQITRGIIMWCEHMLCWAFYPDPYTTGTEHGVLGTMPSSDMVVIGNHRDNSELLTKETNAKK